ncbi:MAG: hypothetical protein IJE27_03160 [Anaerotignum sp.]|nr:hypothetical protein [Anaerotignum sp.]
MKEFERMMKEALAEKVRDVEPSEQMLANIRKEADERRKENGFMKCSMRKMVAAAAVIAALSVTCYAAGQLGSVVSSGEPDIRTFAGLEKAEQKLGFDAKYVETFANGMTFRSGGTGETYGMDEDGNKTGKKYKMMTVSYADEKGNEISLNIDGGSPYADAGVEETEGYSTDTYKFVPTDYKLTAEDQEKEAAGELVISVGSDEVEIMQMEYYGWNDNGIYYSLVGFDCGFGEEAMAAMAAEIMAE